MIISRSIILNEDEFPYLGDKATNNDFIIIKINLNKQSVDDQTQFVVEPLQIEPQSITDTENLDDDKGLNPAHNMHDD